MATIQELEAALRKAHAAGNVDHARRFADAIRKQRGTDPNVGRSGVTREQRQAQIAEADAALNYDRRLAGLNRQEQAGRAASISGRGILTGLASIPDIVVSPLVSLFNRATEKAPTPSALITGQRERYVPQQMDVTGGVNYLADLLGAARPETSGERVLSDVSGATSAALTGVGIGNQLTRALSPVAQGVGRALQSRPALQAASAATGATAQGVTRESGGSTGAQIGAGLAGVFAPSAAIDGIPAALSGALSRSVPEGRKQTARAAQQMGIELTPPQVSDSRFLRNAQSLMRSVPFTGAQGRYQEQVGQFNRQLARTIGQEADAITPEVYQAARASQNQAFDDLTARNNLRIDQPLMQRLQDVADKAMTQDMKKLVTDATDAFFAEATTGPGGISVPGGAYQALDSQLNAVIKQGGAPAHYLSQVRNAIRDAMDRSISPEDAQAWRQLRQEYGNRKTLTNLVGKSDSGQIPPAQVMGASMVGNSSREAMAAGQRGPLGDLARIGQLLKEPPSSNTAERLFAGGAMTGVAAIDPVTGGLSAAALNLLSRGMDSRALARLMIQENPGLTQEVAERIIAQSMPAATAVQAQQ